MEAATVPRHSNERPKSLLRLPGRDDATAGSGQQNMAQAKRAERGDADPFDGSAMPESAGPGFASAEQHVSQENSHRLSEPAATPSVPSKAARPVRIESSSTARQEAETLNDTQQDREAAAKRAIEENSDIEPLFFPSEKRAVELAGTGLEPPNRTQPQPGGLSPAAGAAKGTAQLAQLDSPPQLQPVPEAAPIASPSAKELKGDGTVGENVPKGPQQPKLTIEKTAPKNTVLGQPLVYNILVKNIGSTAAIDVVVDDLIPKGTKLTGTIPRAELSGTRLTWRLGKLKPGEEKEIAVRVIPIAEGVVGSVANVRFAAEVAAQTVVTAPKLHFTVSAPEQVKLGESLVLKFKLTNSGTADATGVIVRNVIPNGLKHANGNDLEYEIGTVPAGKSQEMQLVLTAAEVGDVVNRAAVTADGGVSSEVQTALKVIGAGTRLKLERIGSNQRYLGRPAVFENRVTNDSSRPVIGATVAEIIPAGLTFVEASDGGQYNPQKRSIVWAVGKLDPKQSKVLRATLIPKTPGKQTSVIRAIEPNGGAAQMVAETNVLGFSSLAVQVFGGDEPVVAGGQATYRIAIKNRGSAPATNVRVRVAVPAETQLVSFPNMLKPVAGGKEHPFEPISSLDPGTETTIEIVLKGLRPGDARLGISVQSDQMQRPLSREEAILILPATP